MVASAFSEVGPPPSPAAPLGGHCLCGAVRFEVREPFVSAGYCHCTHCQRRTGTTAAITARVPREGFELLAGRELIRAFTPPGGKPKLFCSRCGSGLFSGDPFADELVAIRFGVLDRDPGIRPDNRQHVDSAASWEAIPDDGLTRYPGPRPG